MYLIITVLTAGLAVWYQKLMTVHVESRIQIEEWILLTLRLATASQGLKTLLVLSEVYIDHEVLGLELLSDVVGSIAAGVSRWLYLVLAMGLGVIKSELSKT